MDGGRNENGDGNINGDRERERDRTSDTSAPAAQSRRPPYVRCNTDSQVSHQRHQLQNQHQQQQQQQHRKHQKRVVGGGASRVHARVSSTKTLHKSHSQSTTKLKSRASSPEPERPPMFAQSHRRTTSDLRLTSVAPESSSNFPSNDHPNLDFTLDLRPKKNHSNVNLATKRNRSLVDIAKRSKSAANIKNRSSSRENTQKLKSAKNQVHFDLGNDGDGDGDGDGNEDEWVDASASASPYLSRRCSVVSGGQSPAKPHPPSDDDDERPQSPEHRHPSPTRQIAHSNDYITSRLLQRAPSHGAPPQMSTESVSVHPNSGSPISQAGRGPPSLYGTPKTVTPGASGPEGLISRFVDGSRPNSGGRDSGSFFVPPHTAVPTLAPARRGENVRPSKSLVNLSHAPEDQVSDEEDGSTLVPRSRRPVHMAAPASQSRTQQKLNLQRASSSMEPTQTGPGVGAAGASLLVGSNDYEHRDPRISKLLERTGMEYLVVRRYQNPIARSIARLSQLSGTTKSQRIPRQNGTNGSTHGRDSMDLDGVGRLGSSQSMTHMARSRPSTPRRSTSIRTVGPRSSYEGDDGGIHEHISGSSLADANDDELTTILRNLWDKSTDLGTSPD
ncbi:hypothetical protein F4861DRAFT_406440 [Xylaria intraflava]|nr:hypothetical protein F4861DRAFT_406440 [Xylaria intraflava]